MNYNGIMDSFLPFYEKETNLLKADKVVLWNGVTNPQVTIINLAKEYGKETIEIEHGMCAVSDYKVDLKDTSNGMGGKPFIADKICVWGKRSAEIMYNAGAPKEKVFIVGSPILWNYEYRYTCDDEERILAGFGGTEIKDKQDGRVWKLMGHREYIPTNKERKYIIFFPYHDATPKGLEENRKIWQQIKNRDDVVVKLSSNYANEKDDNPFKELVKYETKRAKNQPPKAFIADTRKQLSTQLNKKLLEMASCAVMGAPGTTNGICYAMQVPTIVPKIDWGWRVDGKLEFDIHKGDYDCEPDKINEAIDKILEQDTKIDERRECAEEFMGTDLEECPRDLIRRVIDAI
jgi:hypothetical protein